MLFFQRILKSFLWLSLAVVAVFAAQWLEKFVAGWLGTNLELLFFKIKDFPQGTWDLFRYDITGLLILDIPIKIFLGICIFFGLAVLEDREVKKLIGMIIGIPILLYVLVPALLPYAIYGIVFCWLGMVMANTYYLIGSPAVLFFSVPIVLVFSSVSSIFSYNNLVDSIYFNWIREDQASITNFIDFWFYTLRVWIFGKRMFDPFWQYWVALPVNFIFSILFLSGASFITITIASSAVEEIDKKLNENGQRVPSKNSNPIAIFLATLFAIFVLFNCFKWATDNSKFVLANSTNSPKATPAMIATGNIKTSLSSTNTLSMDGSVTMVKMMKFLREGYRQVNPRIKITYGFDTNGKPSEGEKVRPTGSSGGIKNLIKGTVTMAASSRPLKPDEAKAGIKLIQVGRDAIAVVVGINNPFKGGITTNQLRQIYQGQITNWSKLGGQDKPIKVYNRGVESGTRDFFKEHILLGDGFAPDTENFKTWERDETTAVLRVIEDDGIYYTSVFQAQGQKNIRVVPIEGINPLNRDTIKKKIYPISRDLYLAIPTKTSPEAKQFIEFVLSPKGQEIVEKAGLISIF